MKHLFLAILFVFSLGFGAIGQYKYNYSVTTTKKDNSGDNRNITIELDFTLDSLYKNYSNATQGYYGFYFTYDIRFYHNGKELGSNDKYKFDNLRLKFRCGNNGETDFGLPLTGGAGSDIAYNSKYSNDLASATLESLGCNELQLMTSGPGLSYETATLNPVSTLPIELINFEAKSENQQVDINWSTASELNNDYFTIERSADGMGWETVQTVEGSGNSSRILNYSWTDYSPFAGISYYRLTQTDFDGASEVFNIISVENRNVVALQAYPNPAITTSTLKGVNEHFALQIFNSMGTDVTGSVNTSTLGEETKLDLSQLPKGIYYVVNGEESIQLVKQ